MPVPSGSKPLPVPSGSKPLPFSPISKPVASSSRNQTATGRSVIHAGPSSGCAYSPVTPMKPMKKAFSEGSEYARPPARRSAAIPVTPPVQQIHHAQEEHPYILSYIRNLAGVTEILTDEDQDRLPIGLTDLSATIGPETIEYLTAHGYTTSSQKIVQSAFKRSTTEEAFSAFLCGKGMSKMEAGWLWNFICREMGI
ncbi:hypothetical protein FIBSPDRAFT_963147 [Athelia psychrophila]|uniref:Uncharacterized protein n=1 Tax=Athelia psychrophila TaxID=1759441 RepID=A0A165ZCF5_9AGAM|nr:hypothetical protein FIBSPDRAFT_963147 [Fibularhizoctonia sp. CBS 109695]